MVTIGVDAHKRVLVARAVDDQGRAWGSWQGQNTPAQWTALEAWGRTWGRDRQWGIEGAGGYGQGLAQALVAVGETVYEVNPRLTAALRRRARRQDKTDRLDAQAVAQAVLREGDRLPRVQPEDETTIAGLLTDERMGAQAEATRLRNQLHARLHLLDPDYQRTFPDLRKPAVIARLATLTLADPDAVRQARAAAVRRLASRLALVLQQLAELEAESKALATAHFAVLTQLPGVGLLQATALAGQLGARGRFRSEGQVAAYAGVAPLEASSAGKIRHRLNRGGNRRLNAVLYRIVLTQLAHHPPARAYVARRQQEGKTWKEAVRALKRYIVRAVFQLWQHSSSLPSTPPRPALT